ncbi:MAG: hypothetical protein KME13_18395 [Myxacorys californica WJT36-NPBG1]|jgi:hypothetical protein|nr:hypothetical protein [Myxacorys californica WJT36-NPBG1]
MANPVSQMKVNQEMINRVKQKCNPNFIGNDRQFIEWLLTNIDAGIHPFSQTITDSHIKEAPEVIEEEVKQTGWQDDEM